MPIAASGRCEVCGGTSSTPRSWHGPASTEPCTPYRHGLPGPVDRWAAVRDEIPREVCSRGFDTGRNTFTQYYGSRELDAALLLLPRVGFLPWSDPRVRGTVDAVRRELSEDGSLMRYRQGPAPAGGTTRASTGWTGLPAARGSSSPARSGWWTPCTARGARARRRSCSKGSSACATTWVS
ncbi:glycoside hydrolase family 15 protein [Streptomyces globosus]|uniref:glycoside hydrolase family 15 protein n=1 Tax=Streptomyces globosus TaxID=68209 RepID=UPI003D16A1D9